MNISDINAISLIGLENSEDIIEDLRNSLDEL